MERQAELQKQRLQSISKSADAHKGSPNSRQSSNEIGQKEHSPSPHLTGTFSSISDATIPASYATIAKRSKPTGFESSQTAPSYISVKKRNMTPKNVPATSNAAVSSPSPSAAKEEGAWPKSLTSYCDRVLSNCPPNKCERVQIKLRALIVKARDTNALWDINWDEMPIPDTDDSSGSTPFVSLSSSSSSPPHWPYLAKNGGVSKHALSPSYETQSGKKRQQSVGGSYVTAGLGKGSRIDSTLLDAAQNSRRDERLKRFKCDEEAESRELSRKKREIALAHAAFVSAGAEGNPDVADWDEFTIVGTCKKLEKAYLRLTSAPDPTTVRPLHILKQTLDLLKKKWKEEHNYTYICDQFKSLRQDLTVQRVKSEFTVKVYETHARIALQKGDLGEYNQCQAQLKQLYYIYKLPGSTDEFISYRIIYMLHTMNKRDLFNTLMELSDDDKRGECVRHALAVRSALTSSNYHALFGLYHDAPKMSGYLMDHFMERERQKTLCSILKAFRPSVGLEYLAVVLGFVPKHLVDCVMLPLLPTSESSCTSDRKTIVDAIDAAEVWLDSMNVVWVAPSKPCAPVPDQISKPKSTARSLRQSVASTTKHTVPSSLKYVDCKASAVVVADRAKATFAKGVDIKGQIH
ncbi:hypothetical protein BSLG_000630 [Batrachochytrium salamandrivorans]|nr:hypothetical protein BSLG_000630 [Batrachochytrium salamandrivorans]